jgi:deoxyribodipyrimidine photo-lyase
MSRNLVWFRGSDLRVADQAALRAAAKSDELVCVFLVPSDQQRPGHDRFLRECVRSLGSAVENLGGRLDVLEGDPRSRIPGLAEELGVDEVHTTGGTLPGDVRLDGDLAARLGDRLRLHPGHTLARPGSVRTGSGSPYAVFTPFSNKFRDTVTVDTALPVPDSLPAPPADWSPKPVAFAPPDNGSSFAGGEDAARERLARVPSLMSDYPEHRDRMDLDGTSRLSADLKFGTLSPREVWHVASEGGFVFRTELIWREFNYSIAATRPEVLTEPFRPAWRGFPWRADEQDWTAWRDGLTGYPIVDAACRQLLAEGFVHNRARMVSASFLTKHLLIEYSRGEEHYLTHLVDGDPAQNNAGWQWSAGCGCDAQPWFRIFNPMTQGKRFDPQGDYVRRWVPELRSMPSRWIHEPWLAPASTLEEAGVRLGTDYPQPIVDHKTARERFLATAKSHLG